MEGNPKKKLFPWRTAAYLSAVLALLAAMLLLMQLLGISCPIKHLTGISCPGCGMTRACLSALRLDFSAAFTYHPLWIALPPVAALALAFYFKQKKKALSVLISVFAAAMLAVYLWRMLFLQGEVVTFAPESGLIGKWIGYLKKILPA